MILSEGLVWAVIVWEMVNVLLWSIMCTFSNIIMFVYLVLCFFIHSYVDYIESQ
jgi:hypothetical protein